MKTKFQKTPTINHVNEIPALNLKRGQWIQLAWCEKKSRYLGHTMAQDGVNVLHVSAVHFPCAATYFNTI